jgi:hypothetical protein
MNYYNYFTEIEEHFVRRRGKHLLISPMDWCLIASWRDAGVPLQVAIRGIDIAMDGFFSRKHGSSKVNSLCYCHDSVMTEYASYLEAHVGESPENSQKNASGAEDKDEPGIPATMKLISERISEIKAIDAKQLNDGSQEGLQRVIARLEELQHHLDSGSRMDSETLERDLSITDELLMTELRSSISAEEVLEWEKEAKRELKMYRKRLPRETYEKIRGNFIRDRIHRKFSIGEMSIFRL